MTAARRRAVPVAAFAVMAVTVAVGLWLARHDGRELGLPFPPFVGRWDPAATAWAFAAAALSGLAIWAAPRLLALPPAAFAAAVFALTLALRLALGATSRGTERLVAACSTSTASRGRTSTCPRSRRCATGRASCSTASRSWSPRCPSTPPGTRPACC